MKKFKNMSELAIDKENYYGTSDEAFREGLNELTKRSKEEALAICRHFKKSHLLSDNQIPEKAYWDDRNDVTNPPTFGYITDGIRTLGEFQKSGLSAIAMLMWMFDISKEEVCKK